MQRRSFLGGLAGCLAAGFAPAAVGSNILMPTKRLLVADRMFYEDGITNDSETMKRYHRLEEVFNSQGQLCNKFRHVYKTGSFFADVSKMNLEGYYFEHYEITKSQHYLRGQSYKVISKSGPNGRGYFVHSLLSNGELI
jgi:hypothetical protein